MQELERIEAAEGKVSKFQKKYNLNQKKAAGIIGRNITLFLCLLVPVLLISFIWTDFSIVFYAKMLADGALTVCLFVTGEQLMTRLGSDGGRMDPDYLAAKNEFDGTLTKVHQIGTMLLGIFCDWQVDMELEQARRYRLRLLRMTPQQLEDVKDLGRRELEDKFGRKKGRKVFEVINLEPIELNEAILLYNGEHMARGGVPESGDEYLHRRSHVITTLIACVFTGLLTVAVAFTLTSDITVARVIYTVFKLTMLLFRMAKGYDRGAKAYNTVEVKMYQAKTNYLYQYLKFVEEKMYLKLGDKYGEISYFMNDEAVTSA